MITIAILQYIGVGLVLVGQLFRTDPHSIIYSFLFSAAGSLTLLLYSVLTGQFGFVALNVTSAVLALIGFKNWYRIRGKINVRK